MPDEREVIHLPHGGFRPTRTDLQPYYQMKALASDTEGRFSAFVSAVPSALPLHVHEQDEGFLLLEGEVEVYSSGKLYRATPGTWMLLPRDVPHALRPRGDENPILFCIQSPAGFEHFAEITLEHLKAGKRDYTSPAFLDAISVAGFKMVDGDFWEKQDANDAAAAAHSDI
jgi:mannose-6-phosphate isomerase-like protein (cupin superfamily)